MLVLLARSRNLFPLPEPAVRSLAYLALCLCGFGDEAGRGKVAHRSREGLADSRVQQTHGTGQEQN